MEQGWCKEQGCGINQEVPSPGVAEAPGLPILQSSTTVTGNPVSPRPRLRWIEEVKGKVTVWGQGINDELR